MVQLALEMNKLTNVVYICKNCHRQKFVFKSEETIDEGVLCPACGNVLLKDDLCKVGIMHAGEMYYYKDNDVVPVKRLTGLQQIELELAALDDGLSGAP